MAKAKVIKKFQSVGMELPECPVCMEDMSAPIFQCQSGHSLCSSCTKNLCPPICPICRQAMTQIRNWQLEEIISKASVSCPNKASGCNFTLVKMDEEDHLKECFFRDMACPLGAVFGKCSWSGKLNVMLAHFEERHPENCILNGDGNINLKNISISADDRYMYLTSQNKFLFIISFKIDTRQKMAYWAIQHIGSKKIAQQHVYGIHVTSNQDNRRNVIFSDHCFNDVMNCNEIFNSGKCPVMPLAMLSHFLKDGKLTFCFTLKRSQPPFKKDARPGTSNINTNKTDNQQKGLGPNNLAHANAGNTNNQGKNFRGKSPGLNMNKGPKQQQKRNNN